MTENQQNLKDILLSGALQEINFYQMNKHFFELPEEGFWVIDGGIELKFPSGIVSAAWDLEFECYVIKDDAVRNIYKESDLVQLKNEHISKLERFVGQTIVEANFKNLEFEYIVDYTMRTEKEKRFVELILDFENKTQIQIAFADYVLGANKIPTDFSFSIQPTLLISTKKIMPIAS